MRFRDIIITCVITSLTVGGGLYGGAVLNHLLYHSNAINRDDARSVAATAIPKDQWVEFQILRDATNIRLLTNAALNTMDAPDHDLTNPRLGWRYSLDYELLDANRKLLESAEYHFRTHVRQLVDAENGDAIYPIFLGKSGLVATQTRPMQLAVTGFETTPAILRVRLKSSDSGIQEVVGRSLSRIQRDDFDKRYTWNRLSQKRRDLICKYTVYEANLLSSSEHTNLLRWRWAQTSTLNQSPRRQLFFIGDLDDQEVRDEQLPAGLFTDPNWLATIPVPEGPGNVRLEFHKLDQPGVQQRDEQQLSADVRWFGLGIQHRKSQQHLLTNQTSSMQMEVNGGLLQIDSPQRLVIRAFWSPLNPSSQNELSEIEITPAPVLIKTFVVDQRPIEYSVSHLSDAPTPLRLSVRYPFGPHFDNLTITAGDDPALKDLSDVSAKWEFLDRDGQVVDSGHITLTPTVSRYEFMKLIAGYEWLSEPEDRFFAVPVGVDRVRLSSASATLLVNASVRPAGVSRVTRIPEDYHIFHARQSPNRSWFGINPPDAHDRIQSNRSFIIRSHARPPEDSEEILAGNYERHSFQPKGNWIGRQILVPQEHDAELRQEASGATYFELTQNVRYSFDPIGDSTTAPARLLVVADDAPGQLTFKVNQQTVFTRNIHSARSDIDLAEFDLPSEGILAVSSTEPARFFVAGSVVANADRFIKRTAQRIIKGALEFTYAKTTHEDEIITMQLYRAGGDDDRCKIDVKIQAPDVSATHDEGPMESWTIRDRTYDLRPHPGQQSVLLGGSDPVDVGHRCFVRLGKELSPGLYTITVRHAGGSINGAGDEYVVLSRTLPGARPKRQIRVQTKQTDHEL